MVQLVSCYLSKEKEMIPWLCTNRQFLENQAKRKRELLFSHIKKSPLKTHPRKQEGSARIVLGLSVSMTEDGFVCYLLSCCVAFYNREESVWGKQDRFPEDFP
jgi:hypothetical protein